MIIGFPYIVISSHCIAPKMSYTDTGRSEKRTYNTRHGNEGLCKINKSREYYFLPILLSPNVLFISCVFESCEYKLHANIYYNHYLASASIYIEKKHMPEKFGVWFATVFGCELQKVNL
jgi:hypothetical protein